MSSPRDERERFRTIDTWLRVAYVAVPVVVFFATLVAGGAVHAFGNSLLATVDSPVTATILLGLSFFPGGASFILRGIRLGLLHRASRFWPTVKGHMLPYAISDGFAARFWYVVNGQRFDHSVIQLKWPSPKDVEVRFDPEDPEVAVLAQDDDTAWWNIAGGLITIAMAPVLGVLLVWMSN
jgi:hypothetical protein